MSQGIPERWKTIIKVLYKSEYRMMRDGGQKGVQLPGLPPRLCD